VGRAGHHHLGSASLPDNQKWAKRQGLVATLRNGSVSSGNPPVTQVTMPLIMQNFKA